MRKILTARFSKISLIKYAKTKSTHLWKHLTT